MMNCIVVDDEPLALDLLEDNIRQVPFLRLLARCNNAFEAVEVLRKEKTDLVFLDIQMPGMSGMELVASLPHPPLVIFISAYEKYAHKGFELDAIDYLVKPVSFERFLKAVYKAQEYFTFRHSLPAEKPGYIFVNSEYSLVKLKFDEILYVEGLKDYVKIYTVGAARALLSRMSMKAMEELLPPSPHFIRVHKSFIISMDKLVSIRKNRIRIAGIEIPISPHYRENLVRVLGKEAQEINDPSSDGAAV